MKHSNLLLSVIFIILGAFPIISAENTPNEALIRDIEKNLIAPCCWNQPISEHYSQVSEQMRQEVREMVAQGKSRDEILDYYVAKYGERILAIPRPKGINALAYILPWTALILGALGLYFLLRKRRSPGPVAVASQPASDNDYSSIIEKELKELDE
jgi:cytochrome c-type biogenesis protein CcmH